MEFGKHIGKGMWGLAGRGLPSVYGIGLIIFVVRVFPPVEFGIYSILQTVFLLTVSTGQNFALQPLVKYGAETDDLSGPVISSGFLYAAFLLPTAMLLVVFSDSLGTLFNSETTGNLMYYISLMLIVSFPRNLASYLLQARLELRTLFFLDAIYSLGSLLLIAILESFGRLHTAEEVMKINLLTLALSSIYGTVILIKKYSIRIAFSAEDLRKTWEYGKYSLGASISFTLYSQSDNLIISSYMGPIPLATYNAAKVFTRAYDLLLQMINTLLVPVVSRANSRNDAETLKTLAEKSLLFFTIMAFCASIVLVLLGPALMGIIYGDKYADSVPVLYILACAGIFIPGIAVGAAFCNGVAKIKPIFYFNLLTAVVGIPLMAYLTSLFGIIGSAYAGLTIFALLCPTWIAILVRYVGVPLKMRDILRRYTDITAFVRNRFGNV